MQHNQHAAAGGQNHYLRLLGMIVLSFISMYVLMYSMVNSFADVYNSLNQVYMAGLMTAPMVVIELWLMSSMYTRTRDSMPSRSWSASQPASCSSRSFDSRR